MALSGRIEWKRTIENPTGFDQGLLNDASVLLKNWQETGERAYLDQWFYLADSYARYSRCDFDTLTAAERKLLNSGGMWQSWNWNMGFGNEKGWSMHTLRQIIQALPKDNAGLISPRQLANIILQNATDYLNTVIKDPRTVISNQVYINAMSLIVMAKYLPEFRDADTWFNEGRLRFERGVYDITSYPDGGDMEQSLNYNNHMPNFVNSLKQLLAPDNPEWLQQLNRAAVDRRRLMAVMQQPIGGLPATGTASTTYPPAPSNEKAWVNLRAQNLRSAQAELERFPDPVATAIADQLWGQTTTPPPAFTSVAFPYSGYYVMREGWENSSPYLWLMAARAGSGHACENINAIDLIAYGRHLLTPAGASSYGNRPGFVPEDQHHLIQGIDHYRDQSFSRNTVVVDGYSQNRLQDGNAENTGSPRFRTPAQNRWHSSAHFDFAEGQYADGYGNTTGVFIDATHHRQVLYVKDAPLWIITDRMTSDQPHTYTQCWNFPAEYKARDFITPGFAESEVVIDATARVIHTTDPDGANLFLHHFSAQPVDYKKFFGTTDPYRGWQAPGIAGRRYPKVDVQTSWQGNTGTSLMVTALLPVRGQQSPVVNSADLSQGSINGCRMVLENGMTVTYLATPTPMPLQENDIIATAEALLVTTTADGATRGIALGCDNLQINEKRQRLTARDFEFTLSAGTLHNVTPIIIPTTFNWETTPQGIVPCYDGKR